MKRFLVSLLLLAGACTPSVPQSGPPGNTVVVQFDLSATPPVVPSPNDLAIDADAGKIAVPSSPTDTPAQTEFNQQYLGTLGGFPYESTATVLVSGALDPSTVGPSAVVALDLTTNAPVALAPSYDPTSNTIAIPPPGGGWTRAHRYAIALVAAASGAATGGLRGLNGEPVIGSPSWALVSSPSPLVDCPNGDLTSPSCTLAVDVIPSTLTDPTARLAQQLQNAKQLEAIRLGYNPLLAAVEMSRSVPLAQIPILWTFTVVDAGEMTFNPAGSIIPFPNDVLRPSGLVALPNPATGQPLTAADCMAPDASTLQLYCGLNTLDGFSTIAAPISENGLDAGALEQADIDPATLKTTSVGLAAIASTAPAPEQTTPIFAPCLNCLSSPLPDGGAQTSPQQLQWNLTAPLDEKTTYLAWVTGAVADTTGKGVIANPSFALVRLANPLVQNGHSTVNVLTDAQAAQLEPLRLALKPALDGLAAQGIARTNIALAWGFTTQTEASALDALQTLPGQVPNLPDSPLYVFDATAQYQAIAASAGIDDVATNLGKILVGVFLSPVAVTGPGGTLNPGAPRVLPVTFTLALPASAAPSTGYPVTIFTHGFTRSREDFLAIAGALAAPTLGPLAEATIATDIIFHGERTSCTGSTVATMATSDDGACANPTTQKCNEDPLVGRCVARDSTTALPCRPGTADDYAVCAVAGQGACVGTGATGACEGGDFLRDNYETLSTTAPQLIPFQRPVISGWNVFSLSNFFATRDNFRQEVIDLAQLVRVVESSSTTSLSAQASLAAGESVSFDASRLGYVGQSLGSILGTLYNAVSPDTTNVVLNVPGGDLPQIILNAPSFAAQKQALLDLLAAQGITPGTPAFDQFIGIAQWVLDPADPSNMGWRLTHPVDLPSGVTAPNPNRNALIQFIEGDQTVPNITNLALVMAANRSFVMSPPSYGCMPPLTCYEFTEAGDGFDTTSAPLADRHGFMLSPPTMTAAGIALTTKAQTQVTSFLATGMLP